MLGWTPEDLKVISDEYLSTSEFQSQALEELRPLLDKYEILGRELSDLSQILERSGRQSKSYRDTNLERHIREAKQDLQEHFHNDRPVLARFRRSPLGNSSKIAKLLQQANDHFKDARDFKIGFLLDTRLEAFLEKELEDGRSNIPHFAPSDRRMSQPQPSPLQRVQSASSNLQVPQTEDHPTGNLVDDASGAIRLARVVWKNTADMSSNNPDRHRPLSGQTSARQQYVADVAEVIRRAELYAAGIDGLDDDSRRALEEIVSKAVQLKYARSSPIITASLRGLNDRRRSSGAVSIPQQLVEEDRVAQRISSLTGEWLPYSPLQLPESAMTGLGLEWPTSNETSQVERNAFAMAPHDVVFAAQPTTPSSFHGSSASGDFSLFQPNFRLAIRNNTGSTEIMQDSAEHEPRGWVRISSSQLGLPPTICTLSVDEIKGEVHIYAAFSPRSANALSVGGSDSSRRGSSNPSILGSISSQSSDPNYTHKFKHFLKAESRTIPTVRYPKYEGPVKSPWEPFTIMFKEAQLITEGDFQERLQKIGDLRYIFSDREYRDEIRALMFGKSLLASAGVTKIEFDHIACLRQAVSLWSDKITARRTITFFRDHNDRKHKAPGEVEYEVIGIEESKRSAKDEDPIVLFVELLLPQSSRQRCSLYFSDTSGKQDFFNLLCPA